MAFRDGETPQVIFAPRPRQSVESVGVGRDKIYAAITDNVTGAVHAFTKSGSGWSDTVLALPKAGSADIVSTNDDGPQALFSFQNYLTPTTLYFDTGNDAPKPIKSLPARFDASGLVTEQFEATVKGRHENSVFRHPAQEPVRPSAHRAVRLWRLRDFAHPRLQRQFRAAMAHPWRHLCGGQYPRRRRVRAGLAQCGAQDQPPARL